MKCPYCRSKKIVHINDPIVDVSYINSEYVHYASKPINNNKVTCIHFVFMGLFIAAFLNIIMVPFILIMVVIMLDTKYKTLFNQEQDLYLSKRLCRNCNKIFQVKNNSAVCLTHVTNV